jgi:type VI secretion system protein ImpH
VRSAKGLQQLLRGYFGFPSVKIREFESCWVEIPVKTCLGVAQVGLGKSTRLGDMMQDSQSRFTVEIGPVPRSLFNRFLPSTPDSLAPKKATESHSEGVQPEDSVPLLAQVRELIDAYLRDPLDYQLKIILQPEAGQIPVLGSEHAKMGMGIWLGTSPAGEVSCRL